MLYLVQLSNEFIGGNEDLKAKTYGLHVSGEGVGNVYPAMILLNDRALIIPIIVRDFLMP